MNLIINMIALFIAMMIAIFVVDPILNLFGYQIASERGALLFGLPFYFLIMRLLGARFD